MITGLGIYGSISKTSTFEIYKAKGVVKLKAKKKLLKVKAGKKLDANKYMKITRKTGKLAYKKIGKTGGKRILVNPKTGAISVRKGLKKRVYTLRIKLISREAKNYKQASNTIRVKLTVTA